MAIGNGASLLLRIKGDSSDAVRALNNVRKEAGDLKPGLDGLGSALSGLVSPAALVTAGVTALATGVAAGGVALFNLAKNAAEYGSEIYNASVKTGLTTETISALKLASERTGVSMESLGTIVNRFSRLVGEAAQGSEKAKETLTRLGIDPKEAIDNLDGSLAVVFKRINDLQSPIERATLAQQAFGKAGTELLKVIDDFNGDLPKAIERARELGLVMSKEDAEAADEFGDQLDTLNAQLAAVGRMIGKEVLPVFNQMAKDVSDWLKENPDAIRSWGKTIANVIAGVRKDIQLLIIDWEALQDVASGAARPVFLGGDPNYQARAAARQQRRRELFFNQTGTDASGSDVEFDPTTNTFRPKTSAPTPPKKDDDQALKDFDAIKKAQEEAKKAAEKAAQEAEELRKRQREGQLGQIEAIQEREQHALEQITAANKAAFEARAIDAKTYLAQRLADEEEYAKGALEDIEREYALRRQQEKLSSEQLKALNLEEENERQKIVDRRFEREEQAKKEVAEREKKLAEERLGELKDEMSRRIEVYEATGDKIYAIAVQNAEKEGTSALALARLKETIEERVLQFRLDLHKKYFESLDAGSKEYLDVQSRIKVLEQQLETLRATNATNQKKRIDETLEGLDDQIEKLEEIGKLIQEQDEKDEERIRRKRREEHERETDAESSSFLDGLLGSIGGLNPVNIFGDQDALLEEAEFIKNVWTDLEGHIGGAIGSMVDGLAQMAAAWLATGKFSAQAALQMASSVAISLAMQAGVAAIMELAKGWAESAAAAASAAVFDYHGAALHAAAAKMHFSAAAIYGTVGGVAAAAGVGLGLAARAAGGGGVLLSRPETGGRVVRPGLRLAV